MSRGGGDRARTILCEWWCEMNRHPDTCCECCLIWVLSDCSHRSLVTEPPIQRRAFSSWHGVCPSAGGSVAVRRFGGIRIQWHRGNPPRKMQLDGCSSTTWVRARLAWRVFCLRRAHSIARHRRGVVQRMFSGAILDARNAVALQARGWARLWH